MRAIVAELYAEEEEMRLRQPTLFLDLIPVTLGAVDPPPIFPVDRTEVERSLLVNGLQSFLGKSFLGKVREERQKGAGDRLPPRGGSFSKILQGRVF